jgi:hypothetical protein
LGASLVTGRGGLDCVVVGGAAGADGLREIGGCPAETSTFVMRVSDRLLLRLFEE